MPKEITDVKLTLTMSIEHDAKVSPDVIVQYAAFLASRSYKQASEIMSLNDFIRFNQSNGEGAILSAAMEHGDELLGSYYLRTSAELDPNLHPVIEG